MEQKVIALCDRLFDIAGELDGVKEITQLLYERMEREGNDRMCDVCNGILHHIGRISDEIGELACEGMQKGPEVKA